MKLIFVTLVSLFFSVSLMANERGAELFKACMQCHGEKGEGIEAQEAPRIAGQHEWYIYSSLVAFKSKERKNPNMYPFIANLNEQDFKDLAEYIAALK